MNHSSLSNLNSILSFHSVLMATIRDFEFYFDDGNAVFKVKSILSKLRHRIRLDVLLQ